MKNLRIESSVREAKKVQLALQDAGLLSSGLFVQEASNVWVTSEYDEEEFGEVPSEEFAEEQLEDLKNDIEELFKMRKIDEVEFSII